MIGATHFQPHHRALPLGHPTRIGHAGGYTTSAGMARPIESESATARANRLLVGHRGWAGSAAILDEQGEPWGSCLAVGAQTVERSLAGLLNLESGVL